jgi:CHAT domain-containing protein
VTGADATAAALRNADLSKTGILLLATHGLLGGDRISRLPAVVLTPDPSNPADSGLFTTEDIAGLNLDSVWLAIIAACHTAGAAPDSLEEGLSGLGLAFATAGAKALVLSYWDAEPSATNKLLQRALALIAGDQNLTLSAALAASMRELRSDKRITPEQWAPFVVIGDGATKLPKR